ncbi:hypothetical protein Ancab_016924 [Ancistrocladus abbreviatus]
MSVDLETVGQPRDTIWENIQSSVLPNVRYILGSDRLQSKLRMEVSVVNKRLLHVWAQVESGHGEGYFGARTEMGAR